MRRLLTSRYRFLAPPLVLLGLMCIVLPLSSQPPASKTPPKKKDFIPDLLMTPSGGEQVAYINELIEKNWQANKLEPSERCSDYTFIRRASLDLIGRIAKPHEIDAYMRDPMRERRSRLIERLLDTDEFAQNFGGIWTVHLLTRSGSSPLHQEQLREWIAEKMTEKREGKSIVTAPDWSQIVTELLTATGKTNENGATNFILHHMGEAVPQQDKGEAGAFDMVPVTSRTTKLFLGLRTQCVQCHDNKFQGEWNQHHFWGINAFFRQVDAPLGRPTVMVQKKKKAGEIEKQFELVDNPALNANGKVFYERRNTLILPTDSTFLDNRKIEKPGQNRRKELAKFIIGSPYFAKAFVNRTWGHFLGKSFTNDAPDDFGEHNPVTNPELLDRLAEDFVKKANYNPKDLIRWICNSRAYSLASVANKTNDKPEDEVFFSRMLLKSMSPEQLFDSLMVATQAKVAQAKDARIELRREWLKKLIANFGDDEGNEVSYNGTVVQALILINGKDMNDAIMDKENGTVANILKRPNVSHNLAMRDIYLAAYNRLPTEAEYSKILNPKIILFRPDFQKTVPMKTEQQQMVFWTGFYQDMMWAVLNTSEFILNH
jgi:Protein of unknown function (DUF1549)/Protein of unknown function (DUF1553)